MRHIISTGQFDRNFLDNLFDDADLMESSLRSNAPLSSARGRIMATLFYEPSTRTRLSFESAMLRLGGKVISTENAAQFSSAAKGETLEDTIKIVGGYADVIVLRHHERGAAGRAASVSPVTVINAGDGTGEHPTQALLDLYTIKKEKGRVDGLGVALAGDLLNGRTVHSLIRLLSIYKNPMVFLVSPEKLRLPEEYKRCMTEAGMRFEEFDDIGESLPRADVIYMTRVQKERFGSLEEYEELKNLYVLDAESMRAPPENYHLS
ncbi:MAG: aspartate carbamoyltransferase [Candidatus Aenigmarchaeota archaeon]|nr:aspartate carbamoyltransferase [Candidatus Aenigmarchaeota archaeon]